MHYRFRPLAPSDFRAAYSIVCERTNWLLSKGINQWQRPLPESIYAQRHQNGENYGLWLEDELTVVVSLLGEKPSYWQDAVSDKKFCWLATLASRVTFKGRGLGRVALDEAEQWASSQGNQQMLLDCAYGQGFLLDYYQQAGYKIVTRNTFLFSGHEYDSVLMTKNLASAP